MNVFFDQKGTVRIILGKGSISLYEASNLKEGDVFKVSRYAGEPAFLFINNEFLCWGEIVIPNDFFGFRVSGFNEPEYSDLSGGIKDHVVEILPTEIQLGSLHLSINELKGITIGSMIGMENKYDKDENVELIVAGIPLAAGRLVVIRENIGMRITRVYNQKKLDVAIRSSGFKVDEDLLDFPVKDYDFRRPDKFTWATFLKIKEVHKLFIDNLKLSVPGTKNYKVLHSDQLAFYEIFDLIKGKEYSYFIIDADMNLSSTRTKIHPEYYEEVNNIMDEKIILFQENSINPAAKDKEFAGRIKKLIEQSFLRNRRMIIAYHKSHPFSGIKDENSINELILSPLRNGWKSISGINLKLAKISSDFYDIKIIPDMDMILTVDIGEENKPESIVTIIYPYITIEPIIYLLSR